MPRLIKAPLFIDFEEILNEEIYLEEFEKSNQNEEDIVGQWLKMAKARGETSQSYQVMLMLMAELHRNVDELAQALKKEAPKKLELSLNSKIESIGFEHLKLKEEFFKVGSFYYGRVLLPVFPKREISIFLEPVDATIAKIVKMHQEDRKDWDAYFMARERILIREQKAEE